MRRYGNLPYGRYGNLPYGYASMRTLNLTPAFGFPLSACGEGAVLRATHLAGASHVEDSSPLRGSEWRFY